MNRRNSIRATASVACAIVLGAMAPQQAKAADEQTRSAAPRYRVVMQVSNPEPRGWHQALNNSLALTRNAGRQNVDIEIVAIGAGLGMLKYNSPWSKEVAAALNAGVKVIACGETMKALMLEKDDMLPGIVYVPGGLIEVIDRQRDGWHYVKAD